MEKHIFNILALAVGTLAGMFFILRFAFSDYIDIHMGDSSILETKPWRPESRVIFGGVVLPIYLAFVGWFVTALHRDRSHRRMGKASAARRYFGRAEQVTVGQPATRLEANDPRHFNPKPRCSVALPEAGRKRSKIE